MFSFNIVNDQVVEYDELVLLIVELALLLKHFVERFGVDQHLQSKITRLLVNLNDFALLLATLIRVWTRHAEADCFADVWLARRQVNLHRRIPYILINLDFLKDLVLHLLVEADLLLDVRKDLVHVHLEGILVVSFVDKCLLKHVVTVLLVLVAQLVELEPTHRLDEVVNP